MKSDREVQRMLRERQHGKSIDQAAARAGMSVPTARKYLRAGKLPSQLTAPRTYPHPPRSLCRRLALGPRPAGARSGAASQDAV